MTVSVERALLFLTVVIGIAIGVWASLGVVHDFASLVETIVWLAIVPPFLVVAWAILAVVVSWRVFRRFQRHLG